VEGLYPGCFAIVMATGIISNALFVEGPRLLSDAFFLANIVAYPLLAVLTAVRAARYTHAFWSDLSNRGLVFSFFTIVAASSVFGEGLLLRGVSSIALYLWLFALAAWIALIYLSFSVMTFGKAKLHTAIIQDGCLLAIVGTESLSVLGVLPPCLRQTSHELCGGGLKDGSSLPTRWPTSCWLCLLILPRASRRSCAKPCCIS
jgi:hypothetical protein